MDDASTPPAQLIQELAALRQRVVQLEAVMASLHDPVYVVDAAGRITFCNSALTRLTGCPIDTLLGRLSTTLYIEEVTPIFLDRRKWALEGGVVPPRLETALVRQDGTHVAVELTVTNFVVDGRLVGRIAVVRDLTERNQLLEKAQQAQHLALLGRLAAAVTHEIRNPLSVFTLHMDMLTDIVEEELSELTPVNREQTVDILKHMQSALTHMSDVVEDYLSVARLRTLQREPTDLGVFVQEVLQEIQEDLTVSGITLHREGLQALGEAQIHTQTLRRALRNVLQNAAEAMPQGGSLTVRGQRTASHCQLDITDSGGGIAKDLQEQVFMPLYTTKPAGTGLGLAVVQEIIAAHAGQIEVASEPGAGTTFIITLPVA